MQLYPTSCFARKKLKSELKQKNKVAAKKYAQIHVLKMQPLYINNNSIADKT